MNPWQSLWVALPAWCVAIAIYFPSIRYEFTLDDEASVVKNPDVVDPHAPILDVFFHDFWGRPLTMHNSHQSLRPLTTLSFRFDRWRAELDGTRYKTEELRLAPLGAEALQPGSNDAAHPFHVTNVFLHALASAMLSMFCFRRLGTSKWEAILTGVLFAVHPVHVESVANITGRADVLAFLFLLAYAQNFSLFWSTILGFAATLSKETAVPLLVVDAVVLLWTLPRKPTLTDVKYLFISAFKAGMSTFLIIIYRYYAGARLNIPVKAFEYVGAPLRFEVSMNSSESVFEPEVFPINWINRTVFAFGLDPMSFEIPAMVMKRTVIPNPNPLSSIELVAIYLHKMIVAPLQSGRVFVYDYSYPAWTPIRGFVADWKRMAMALLLIAPTVFIGLWIMFKSFQCGRSHLTEKTTSRFRAAFWMIWLAASLLLPSQFLSKLGTTHADRLAYIGSAAVTALAASILCRNPEAWSLAISVALIAVCAQSTRQHSEDWRNNNSLYLNALQSSSWISARVLYNAATAMGWHTSPLAESPEACTLKLKAAKLLETAANLGPSEPKAWKFAFKHSWNCGEPDYTEKLGEMAIMTNDCGSLQNMPVAHECMHELLDVANDFIKWCHQKNRDPSNTRLFGARLDALLVFYFQHQMKRKIIEPSTILVPNGFLPYWRGDINKVSELCLVRGIDCPAWTRGFKAIGLKDLN